ncbi:MAG: ABC transporter permease, partial [Betaproteobacteria bacterium]
MLAVRLLSTMRPALGAIGFILVWWAVTAVEWIDPVLLPSPQASAIAIWEGFAGGSLVGDTLITIRRTLMAFAIAVGVCVPLGLALGSSATLTSEAFTRAKARCLDVFQREVKVR